MRSVFVSTTLVFILLGLGATVGSAAPITFALAGTSAGRNAPPVSGAGDTDPTSAAASFALEFGSSSYVGEALASAAFGQLGAAASVTLVDYLAQSYQIQLQSGPFETSPAARGFASFTDDVIFSGGTGQAFAVADFVMTGSASVATNTLNNPMFPGSPAVATVQFRRGSAVVRRQSYTTDGTFTTPGLSFTFDSPFTFSVELFAEILPRDFTSLDGPYDMTASADFASTLVLSNITVYADAALTNPLTNLTLTTASGARYPLSGAAAVPEPMSFFLVATGLAGLALRRSHTRAQRRLQN